MSPFRWDVLLVAFVLALPVLLLGLRGDLSPEEMTTRLPWCLAAGWGVVALLRFAGTPRTAAGSKQPPHASEATVPEVDGERFPVG
jgi:hypothetical protein